MKVPLWTAKLGCDLPVKKFTTSGLFGSKVEFSEQERVLLTRSALRYPQPRILFVSSEETVSVSTRPARPPPNFRPFSTSRLCQLFFIKALSTTKGLVPGFFCPSHAFTLRCGNASPHSGEARDACYRKGKFNSNTVTISRFSHSHRFIYRLLVQVPPHT